jgi:hypothetical protein
VKGTFVCFAVLTVFGVALSSPAGASPTEVGTSEASPRSGAFVPRWNQVPAATLPERAQVQQQLVDQNGLVHVFFTVNEGLNVPPSLNVVSWKGTGWSPVTKLGPIAFLEAIPAVSSELSGGIPTVGWTNFGTLSLARYRNETWSVTSVDVPGYAPSDPPNPLSFAYTAVGTATDGTTSGLVYSTGSCSVESCGRGWTVSWPASGDVASVAPGGGGGLHNWLNEKGEWESLFVTTAAGRKMELWNARQRDGGWTDKTLVASFIFGSVEYLSLSAVRNGDSIVAAWNQVDPQYGDTRQVGSAQRVNGVWSAPEVLASGMMFGGLSVGGNDGPVCARYGKWENSQFGSAAARTLTNGSWSAPFSVSSPGSTSSSSAPCLFFRADFEFPARVLLGVTDTSNFLTPEEPLGGWVRFNRGIAWTVKLTGTSLNAARLTFSQASPPSAPTAPRAQSLKGGVKFSWAAPASPGDGPLTYEYRAGSGSWLKTTRTTVTLKAPKGKTVTISVRAVNSTGPGASLNISGKAK